MLPTYTHAQRVIFQEQPVDDSDHTGDSGLCMDLRCVVGGDELGCPEFEWNVEERKGMGGPGVTTKITAQ